MKPGRESSVLIRNARILTDSGWVSNKVLVVRGSKILGIEEISVSMDGALIIDAAGQRLVPGFVEIHSHGGGGYDFLDNSIEAFQGAANLHAKHGITSICPTAMSTMRDDILGLIDTYEKVLASPNNGSRFLGLHIEGPYFSTEQIGAQDPKYVRNPDPEEYRSIVESTSRILRWDAAPELPGALEFGSYLRDNGILPSTAHSNANYQEMLKAFDAGYAHVTHLYSGTSIVHRHNAYRHAGVVESSFLIDEMTVELIADGHHLPPSLLQLVYRIKGAENIALITDSMRAAGLDDGPSILGSKDSGIDVIVEDGVAKLPDRKAFAGSVATGDVLLKTMTEGTGIPLDRTIEMLSRTPARIVGIDNIGTIRKDFEADLVLLDEHLNIVLTMVGGRVVYQQ